MKMQFFLVPLVVLALCAMQTPSRLRTPAPFINKQPSLKDVITEITQAMRGRPVSYATAQKTISKIKRVKQSQDVATNDIGKALTLGFDFSSRSLLPMLNNCRAALQGGKAYQSKLLQENTQLKQQQVALKERTSKKIQEEVSELPGELKKSEELSEPSDGATKKILAQAKELPVLKNIKNRARIEFGQNALDKMMANKPLKLSDIDSKAHFYKLIDAVSFDPETNRFTTQVAEPKADEEKKDNELSAEEPITPEQEITKIKLGLAKALQEKEELKKELEKQKQLASVQDLPEEEKDLQLAQLKQELKEAKEQYTELEKQKQTQAAQVPSTLPSGGGVLGGAAFSSAFGQLKIRLSFFFGSAAADMLTNLQVEPNVNVLADVIDKKTELMQLLLDQ